MGGVKRFIVKNGKGASGEGANEKGTEEARSVGDGDRIDVVPGAISIF